jgi:hypothetical protein
MNKDYSRLALVVWSVLMLAVAWWIPPGYWTIDDGIKSIAAEVGEGPWSSPIPDGDLRSRVSNPATFPVFVEPFAERIEDGVNPGFSPYTRLLAKIETLLSRRALIVITTLIAIGIGWSVHGAGLSWGFLLLPITFYGLVPWEHGAALCASLTALIAIFVKDKLSPAMAVVSGALLAMAAALRAEHLLLLGAGSVYLMFEKRFRDGILVAAAGAGTALVLVMIAGPENMLRQWTLNQAVQGCGFSIVAHNIIDSFVALGPSLPVSIAASIILILSLTLLDRTSGPRVLKIIGWGGVALFAILSLRAVWANDFPPLALLSAASFALAMPWVLWLLSSNDVWKSKTMAYATVVLFVGVIFMPQSTGVHWGPRLLMFSAPLFLIALFQSNLHRTLSFTALILLGGVQTASSALLVYARYTESSQHITRMLPYSGTPLITTTRAQAIDLPPLWKDEEFFVASTPAELKNILTEFYLLGQDSAWLHLTTADSLLVKTFPENKPVWAHRMSIVNSGNLYRTQWRIYQLVMNRADKNWIPLLEEAAGKAMLRGDERRALFLQDGAVRLDELRAESHSNMALILARSGKTEEAKSAALRALAIDSTLSPTQELLRQLEAVPSE